mmetsp:Transcript_7687/g.22196  ORF Transcript_7687/g.22196 Transcript_7687/m.22196 type:complete len:331 (+) Transcript_7687:175-1167(+)
MTLDLRQETRTYVTHDGAHARTRSTCTRTRTCAPREGATKQRGNFLSSPGGPEVHLLLDLRRSGPGGGAAVPVRHLRAEAIDEATGHLASLAQRVLHGALAAMQPRKLLQVILLLRHGVVPVVALLVLIPAHATRAAVEAIVESRAAPAHDGNIVIIVAVVAVTSVLTRRRRTARQVFKTYARLVIGGLAIRRRHLHAGLAEVEEVVLVALRVGPAVGFSLVLFVRLEGSEKRLVEALAAPAQPSLKCGVFERRLVAPVKAPDVCVVDVVLPLLLLLVRAPRAGFLGISALLFGALSFHRARRLLLCLRRRSLCGAALRAPRGSRLLCTY